MTQPIPEGYNSLTPSLNLANAQEAIDLYKKAFGAKEQGVMKSPDGSGKILHAVLEIGNSKIFVADQVCSNAGPSSGTTFYFYVQDVDASFKQACAAGLTEKFPVTDMFWGDRTGCVQDKFGIMWTIATHTRDVSEDEMKKGAEVFAQQMKNKAA